MIDHICIVFPLHVNKKKTKKFHPINMIHFPDLLRIIILHKKRNHDSCCYSTDTPEPVVKREM
jgi:hypothetical protein